jgi:hypothetical protein
MTIIFKFSPRFIQPAMKWGVYVLSATISCFIVLLLAVLFMLFKYRKKLKESSYSPVDKQSVNFESCVGGAKKPYIERLAQYLLGYSDAEVEGGTDDDEDDIEVDRGLTKLVPIQPSSESDGEYHASTSHVIRPRTQSYNQNNTTTAPQVGRQ